MTGGKANGRIGMERARLRKPAVSQGENTRPGDRVFLAAAAKCMPPMPNHSFPEYAETVKVPRYRIVVEVALHDRFEPLAGLAHRIVHTLTELLLNLPQLRPHAFADRLAPHREPPYPILPADVRDRVSLDMAKDFQKIEPSTYVLRSEILLQGPEGTTPMQ